MLLGYYLHVGILHLRCMYHNWADFQFSCHIPQDIFKDKDKQCKRIENNMGDCQWFWICTVHCGTPWYHVVHWYKDCLLYWNDTACIQWVDSDALSVCFAINLCWCISEDWRVRADMCSVDLFAFTLFCFQCVWEDAVVYGSLSMLAFNSASLV